MTAVKSKITFRTVLDFSEEHLTKNRVQTRLREAEVVDAKFEEYTVVYVNTQIQVGMYTILLVFPNPSGIICTRTIRNRLHQYGEFLIRISENDPITDHGKKYDFLQEINITKDPRFKLQPWSHNVVFNMTDLANIIIHCHRLDKLKAFL